MSLWRRRDKREGGQIGPIPTQVLTEQIGAATKAATLKPSNLLAIDGLLHTYWTADVNWFAVWLSFNPSGNTSMGLGAPEFGSRPYWVPKPEDGSAVPLTVLAFCNRSLRRRIASNPDTDVNTLEILRHDKDPSVSLAADR